jgi:NifU-like protein
VNQENQETVTPGHHTDAEEGETVCYCFDVPDTVIRRVIREHDCTEVHQVTDLCNAGGGCTSCHPDIEELIEEYLAEKNRS